MTILPRPYQGQRDLVKMESILTAGRKAANGAYYVHVGDLRWWMFYTDSDPRKGRICLPKAYSVGMGRQPDGLVTALTNLADVRRVRLPGDARPGAGSQDYDVGRRTPEAHSPIAGRRGNPQDVGERERRPAHPLAGNDGFTRTDEFMWAMLRSLDEPLPETRLPQGYHVRRVDGEGEVCARAAASHGAFGSSLAFEEYWPRMLRFMRSPVYRGDQDLVTVAPDGRFASFCIVWPDPVTKVGLFEPVGTHPDFQRKGLGKAVVVEGLRRLKARGMKQAIVCAEHDNPAARKLYESAGFRAIHKLHTFKKSI